MDLKPEETIARARHYGDESQKAWATITDKRRVWLAFVVAWGLSFVIGAWFF